MRSDDYKGWAHAFPRNKRHIVKGFGEGSGEWQGVHSVLGSGDAGVRAGIWST